MSQNAVLARLDRDGPSTTAALARAEGVKPQSMGAVIASLEAMRLVERKLDASDGRQVIIHLTAKGTEVRKATRDAKLTWLGNRIAELDEDERNLLFAAGEIIKRLAES